MARVTSLFLLGAGVMLLVTWLVAPAASSPQPSAGVLPAPAAPTSDLDRLSRDLERLFERPAPTSTPVASRDPFQFLSDDQRRVRHTDVESAQQSDAAPTLTVVWPALVAILSSGSDA